MKNDTPRTDQLFRAWTHGAITTNELHAEVAAMETEFLAAQTKLARCALVCSRNECADTRNAQPADAK